MSEEPTLTHRIIKGSSIVVLLTVLASPLGYLVKMIYSRTLSPEMFGLFYAVFALFNTLSTYNDLGFGYSLTYLVPKFIRNKQFQKTWNAFKYDQIIEVGTSLLISGVIWLNADWLAVHFFKAPEAKQLIWSFSIYFLAHGFLSAISKFFNGLQQEKFYTSIQFSRLFLILSFSLVMWFSNTGTVFNYSLIWAGTSVLLLIIYRTLLYQKNSYLITATTWDKQLFKQMTTFALPALLINSLETLIASAAVIFLTLFSGLKAVGQFNIILPIVSIPGIFLSPLVSFFFPMVSDLDETNQPKLAMLTEKITYVVPFISFYFSLFIVLFPNALVDILFTNKWTGIVEKDLQLLAVGYILYMLAGFFSAVVSGLGMIKQRLRISLIISIVHVLLSGVLIWKLAVTGAVLATTVTYALTLVLLSLLIRKKLPLRLPVIFYGKLLAAGAVLFIIIRWAGLAPHNFVQLFTYGLLYTVLMTGFGYILGVIERSHLTLLVSLVRKKISL